MIKDFLLEKPVIYKLFSDFVGAEKQRKQIVKEINLQPGYKILDIGCGPADILEFMPEYIEYTGVDSNEKYINDAKKRFKNRGKFYCGQVGQESVNNIFSEQEKFHIILAIGVLHHLNDEEAISFFELAKDKLLPGGIIFTLDGCFTEKQSQIIKFILNMDRGNFVRNEDNYLKLAKTHFNDVEAIISNNLINIPYTHIILKSKK